MATTSPGTTRRFSFQTKVLGPVLAFLVLLPAITVWLVDRHIAEQARIEAVERLSATDAVFRNLVDIRKRNLLSRFRNVVNEPRTKAVARLNDAKTTAALLQDLLEESHGEAAVMFVADESGNLVAGVRRDSSLVTEQFFRIAAPITERAIGGEAQTDTLTLSSRAYNVVAVPVSLDDYSPPIGALVIGFQFSDLALQELQSLTRTEIVLLEGSRVIAGTLQSSDLEHAIARIDNEPPATASSHDVTPAQIGGEHFHLLRGTFARDASAAASAPSYALLASYESSLQALKHTRLVLLGVSTLGIFVSVGVIWFLIGRITQPLRALRDGAEAVGRGDFSARVERFSNDECGDLAETFNRMTANLENSHQELNRIVTTLRSTQDQLVQRESRLRESEEGLRLIIESARDHVIFTLDEHGRVRRWNPAAASLLGYRAEEAEGLNYANFFTAEDRAAGTPQRLLAAAAADGRHAFEGWRMRRDGSRFWADITLSRLPGSESVGFVEITRDITIRKEAEQTLRSARDAAESANRAKSEFLANVTHEFRTPMNGIIGMTSLLLDQPLSSEQREFAETIRTSAEGLLEIVRDVLDISKLEAGRLELKAQTVDLNDLLEKLADLFATRAAKKNIELGFTIAPDVPAVVVADQSRLRQLLANLIDNAIKFTNEGSVDISAERATDQGLNHVRFLVHDTGIGIPAEAQTRLFQPFSQVDGSLSRSFGGTGLGLAITKRLTQLMGGTIQVESAAGRGTLVALTVQAPAAVDGSTIGRNFPPPKLRAVLIVAPSGVARMVERQVRWWGVQAEVASGHDALAIRNKRFDAIVMDAAVIAAGGEAFVSSLLKNCGRSDAGIVVLGAPPAIAGSGKHDRRAEIDKPLKPADLHRALSCRQPARKEPDAPGSASPSLNQDFAVKYPMRTLLVEDNPVNTKVALHLLKKLGYHADTAINGNEALQRLRGDNYDIVFMDLQMPEMDGLTATRKLRESIPASQPPYIAALTANAGKADREACFAAGMHDFLSKPARLNAIATVMENAYEWVAGRTHARQ